MTCQTFIKEAQWNLKRAVTILEQENVIFL